MKERNIIKKTRDKISTIIREYRMIFFSLTVMLWLSFLSKTESYFINYLLVAGIGIYSFVKRKDNENTVINRFISFLIGLFIACSNYSIIENMDNIEAVTQIPIVVTIIGIGILVFIVFAGTLLFDSITAFFTEKMKEMSDKKEESYNGKKMFVITLAITFFVNLLVLILCLYPGILTPDSFSQLRQIASGVYENHHPVIHTAVIGILYNLGMNLTGSSYGGIFVYCIVQIGFTSLTYSYLIKTLCDLKVRKGIILVSLFWIMLMPFNIFYSFTVWKDIPFSCFVCLLTAVLLKFKKTGTISIADTIILVLSSIGTCLFRSNGLIAFVLTVLALFVYFKKNRKLLVLMIPSLIFSLIIKYPVYSSLNIEPTERVELLSIPLQQIARTVVDERENLSDEEIQVISQYMDIDKVSDAYKSYISDPIKDLTIYSGGEELLKEDMMGFIKEWLVIGLHHPLEYIKAWIDQIKGYLNSGYPYGYLSVEISYNPYGLETKTLSTPFYYLFMGYSWLYSAFPLLEVFRSIGLHVWMMLVLLGVNLSNKNSCTVAILPSLALWLTLLISSPVYCEFRYIYALFMCMPLMIGGTLIHESE